MGVAIMKKPHKVAAGITISAFLLMGSYAYAGTPASYTVKAGDSLWKISQAYGVSISQIKSLNGLSGDIIYPGQVLKLSTYSASGSTNYTVKAGDTLWKIANAKGTTIAAIKKANNLTSDMIYVGQVLKIPTAGASQPQAVTQWPKVTYIVQPGDTAQSISKKFGVPAADILKYNYMTADEWFYAGDKIAISGYAPRQYTVTKGESSSSAKVGKLVDWFLEGQYIIKRGDVFLVRDYITGKQFNVKMMGGYNHVDVEPLTANDTAIMKAVFNNQWTWTPRAVVLFKDGINIAASLSGKPHSADTVANNNVTGHFDLYLYNSKPHSESTSTSYVTQHQQMVLKATGK